MSLAITPTELRSEQSRYLDATRRESVTILSRGIGRRAILISPDFYDRAVQALKRIEDTRAAATAHQEADGVSSEDSPDIGTGHFKPSREPNRSRGHIGAAERFDELVELRKEIRRVADVAQMAIEALRQVGQSALADELSGKLGIPATMLQSDPYQG
ncbi:hypothetical protein [Corynebacterium halotolerans]|uniref:hypothetical protein n=1 Tax=Corynebacterium halotolerans TaxID=225326 RepID=UPI003CF36566